MKFIIPILLVFSSAFAKLPDWQELGVNTHGTMGSPIDTINDMGATWVRAEQPWYAIETSPGQYDFGWTDLMLRDLKRRGMKVLFILAYAPAFHSSNGQSNGIPNLNAWKAYVEAMTRRYKDEVDVWEVWNEPNLTEFFVGTARQYFDTILKPAHAIIKRNDPDSLVAAPGLATLYSTKFGDFLKKLRSYGADQYFDILSHHAYSRDALGMKRLMVINKIGKPSILKILQDSRFTHKPFWLTEYGCEELELGGEFNQARCLYDQTKFLGTLQWVKNMFIYNLADDPRYTDKHRWGILDSEFRPKMCVTQLKAWIKY